ncbi:AAA family ATPase [Pseudoflavitalea sp. X16]|uniref:AAA family ATPase n=1 Tax=Paraflavitalea devenefica TaxID=2716334 RepID=UPI00141F4A71|nr:AAA family ATPase [Paraflavitalea devenefica]NII26417.1 AAA family ATPase [Paraflavitalea devenefica]
MELTKLSVDKLFESFSYTINLNSKEKITLLHGQNGLGKTVILRMVQHFFDQNFIELKSIQFDHFCLFFGNNIEIKITRLIKNSEIQLRIERYTNGKRTEDPFITKDTHSQKRYRNIKYSHSQPYIFEIDELFDERINYREIEYIVQSALPELRLVGPGVWLDLKTRREYTLPQLIEKFNKHLPKSLIDIFEFPKWLSEITQSQKIRFIETQRLLNRIKSEDSKYKSAVIEFSQAIIDTIKTTRAEASDRASKLDRTYPKRLLEKLSNKDNINESQIADSLLVLEDKRKLLNGVGLIDAEEEYIQPYIGIQQNEIIKSVLELYITDSNEKLSVYDYLSKRIKLFLDIINRRFLYKTFYIDKQLGFIFKSNITKKDIPLSGLSSGEQHELVLFYILLFNTPKGSLLLIDEPEISLHISWQKHFIDDLKEVIKINEMEILIATHSPDIIGNNWDLTVQLEGI